MKVDKTCDCCGQIFICNAENISACLCSTIQLNTDELAYLRKEYSDCICINCLNEIAQLAKKNTTKTTSSFAE